MSTRRPRSEPSSQQDILPRPIFHHDPHTNSRVIHCTCRWVFLWHMRWGFPCQHRNEAKIKGIPKRDKGPKRLKRRNRLRNDKGKSMQTKHDPIVNTGEKNGGSETDTEREIKNESSIQNESDETEIKQIIDEVDISGERSETDTQVERGKVDIQGERGGTDIQGERSDTDIHVERGDTDIQGERSDTDTHVERGNTDIQGEIGDIDIHAERGETDIPEERGETDISGERGDTDTWRNDEEQLAEQGDNSTHFQTTNGETVEQDDDSTQVQITNDEDEETEEEIAVQLETTDGEEIETREKLPKPFDTFEILDGISKETYKEDLLKKGIRVVKGPTVTGDYIGTVINLIESKPETRRKELRAEVYWDNGDTDKYDVGPFKFQLQLYDTHETHENIECDGCKEYPLRGIRWACAACSYINLCTSCYMAGKHNINHIFRRILTNDIEGPEMPSRASSVENGKQKEVYGITCGTRVTIKSKKGEVTVDNETEGKVSGVMKGTSYRYVLHAEEKRYPLRYREDDMNVSFSSCNSIDVFQPQFPVLTVDMVQKLPDIRVIIKKDTDTYIVGALITYKKTGDSITTSRIKVKIQWESNEYSEKRKFYTVPFGGSHSPLFLFDTGFTIDTKCEICTNIIKGIVWKYKGRTYCSMCYLNLNPRNFRGDFEWQCERFKGTLRKQRLGGNVKLFLYTEEEDKAFEKILTPSRTWFSPCLTNKISPADQTNSKLTGTVCRVPYLLPVAVQNRNGLIYLRDINNLEIQNQKDGGKSKTCLLYFQDHLHVLGEDGTDYLEADIQYKGINQTSIRIQVQVLQKVKFAGKEKSCRPSLYFIFFEDEQQNIKAILEISRNTNVPCHFVWHKILLWSNGQDSIQYCGVYETTSKQTIVGLLENGFTAFKIMNEEKDKKCESDDGTKIAYFREMAKRLTGEYVMPVIVTSRNKDMLNKNILRKATERNIPIVSSEMSKFVWVSWLPKTERVSEKVDQQHPPVEKQDNASLSVQPLQSVQREGGAHIRPNETSSNTSNDSQFTENVELKKEMYEVEYAKPWNVRRLDKKKLSRTSKDECLVKQTAKKEFEIHISAMLVGVIIHKLNETTAGVMETDMTKNAVVEKMLRYVRSLSCELLKRGHWVFPGGFVRINLNEIFNETSLQYIFEQNMNEEFTNNLYEELGRDTKSAFVPPNQSVRKMQYQESTSNKAKDSTGVTEQSMDRDEASSSTTGPGPMADGGNDRKGKENMEHQTEDSSSAETNTKQILQDECSGVNLVFYALLKTKRFDGGRQLVERGYIGVQPILIGCKILSVQECDWRTTQSEQMYLNDLSRMFSQHALSIMNYIQKKEEGEKQESRVRWGEEADKTPNNAGRLLLNHGYLNTAYKTKNECFLENSALKTMIKELWYGKEYQKKGKVDTIIDIVLCLFHVVFMTLMLMTLGKPSLFSCIYKRYHTPIMKLRINMMGMFSFLTAFAYMLLFDYNESTISGSEAAVLFWVANKAFDELQQIIVATRRSSRSLQEEIKEYLTDFWNQLDILIILTSLIGTVIKYISDDYILEGFAKIMFLSSYVMLNMRILNMFWTYEFLGTKLVIIQKMIKITLAFMAIMLVIMMCYNVVDYALLYPNSELKWKEIENIVKNGYWTLYGNFEEDVDTNCSNNATIYKQGLKPRCPTDLGASLSPYLRAVYCLVAIVMLLNLLIAIYTKTSDAVHDRSRLYWSQLQSGFLEEYSVRTIFPVHFKILCAIAICIHFSLYPLVKMNRKKYMYKAYKRRILKVLFYDEKFDILRPETIDAEVNGMLAMQGEIKLSSENSAQLSNDDADAIKTQMDEKMDALKKSIDDDIYKKLKTIMDDLNTIKTLCSKKK